MSRNVFFIAVICVVSLGFLSFKSAKAYFSSAASSTNNTFSAAELFPPRAGDVVINELDWPGSSFNSADEWIELKNTTNHTIDIGNWQLTKWSGSEQLMLTIPSGNSITAGGLFLISNNNEGSGSALLVAPDLVDNSVSLNNSTLQIKLYDGTWNSGGLLIDTAGDTGTPLAGDHSSSSIFYSMERNNPPGDGTQSANWHTATTAVNLDPDGGQNKGTPKASND